jgi:S-adenosylmethionine hydrolase
VDHFGNLVTNFPAGVLTGEIVLAGPGGRVERTATTFADVEGDEPFLYAGSGGRLEVGVNGGRAVDRLDWPRGTEVRMEPRT